MPAVAAFEGAKTYSLMRQPNSGRIGRSPGAVARTRRIASSSSSCRDTSAMLPVASVRMGNAAQPDPTNSSVTPDPLADHGHRALEAGVPGGLKVEGAVALHRRRHPLHAHRSGR